MSPLAWNHNTYYHPYVLRRLPPRFDRALDVGCGAGLFASKLAGRATRVDAVDRPCSGAVLSRDPAPFPTRQIA